MNHSPYKLAAIALALSISSTVSAEHHGGGMSGHTMTHCPMKLSVNQFEAQTLSAAVIAEMQFMHEEEKLARDVYNNLFAKWSTATTFEMIAASEQMHMDRIKVFLDVNGIEALAVEDAGVFTNSDLQALYDELIEKGAASELEAYKVGAFVEELDINDLEMAIANTDIAELQTLYSQLMHASHKHLRAFNKQIDALGGSYSPEVISQEAFDTIIAAENSPMVVGNGIRIADDESKTNACFVSGLSVNGHELQNGTAINSAQDLKVSYQVDVDPNDIGKMADWVVVASYIDSAGNVVWFARNGEQWQEWGGVADELPSSMKGVELEAEKSISILDGSLAALLGEFSIYTGYRLDNNELVYNPAALRFSITSDAVMQCGENQHFMSDMQMCMDNGDMMDGHDHGDMDTEETQCAEGEHFMSDTQTCMSNDMMDGHNHGDSDTEETQCAEGEHFMSDTQTCMSNDMMDGNDAMDGHNHGDTDTEETQCAEGEHFMSDTQTCMSNDMMM